MPAGSRRPFEEEGKVRVHIPQRAQSAGAGDVRGAEGDQAGPLRVEVAAARRARHARRRARRADIPGQSRGGEYLWRAPKTFMRPRALGVRAARIMRERGWRGVARACAKRPSGEKRASRREPAADPVGRRFGVFDSLEVVGLSVGKFRA